MRFHAAYLFLISGAIITASFLLQSGIVFAAISPSVDANTTKCIQKMMYINKSTTAAKGETDGSNDKCINETVSIDSKGVKTITQTGRLDDPKILVIKI